MKARMFAASAIGAALLLAGPAGAQDKKAEVSTVNVTGCLAQADTKNEYSIKDADGKTYGLKAGSELNLKAHLGHKLTITGSPIEEKKEKVKAGKVEESEHLRVSNFSVVSTTCP
jgi:hypothetical protein